MRNIHIGETGSITPAILIILTVLIVFATGVLTWAMSERRNVLGQEHTTQALQVAEAGVDYYRWLLAHNGDDYKDGKNWCCNNNSASTPSSCGGKCGPYVHTYTDYNGATVGQYSILVTPPATGSTILNVESTGTVNGTESTGATSKKVTAKLGKQSLAVYSMFGNSPIWIGEDENVSGPLHSNDGIRFDGTCNALVTSGATTYDTDEANHGNNGIKPGIWGAADADCKQYWSFPDLIYDFSLFTIKMNDIREQAWHHGGIYLPASGKEGYKLNFRSDGKVDIYKVNTVNSVVFIDKDDRDREKNSYEQMQNTTFISTQDIPANGLIFVLDDVWVQGTVNGRVTVAASRFTSTASDFATIIINDNVLYTTLDGSKVLGLLAEGDVLVPRHAPSNLTIDAVMLSQNGHVYRRLYSTPSVVNSISVFGGVITNKFWTWSWVDGSNEVKDGYRNTSTTYDSYLNYSPPPMFPTTENYTILSYTEEK
jgi:Tfp pilus assembly protein PilX